MRIAFLIVINLVIFIGIPAWLIASPKQVPKNKFTSSLGNAFSELDRLLTRPSIEYRVEAEDQDKLSEGDVGGD
jgi:hypothetical protein